MTVHITSNYPSRITEFECEMRRRERPQKVSRIEGLTGGEGGIIFNTNDLEVASPHSPAFRPPVQSRGADAYRKS